MDPEPSTSHCKGSHSGNDDNNTEKQDEQEANLVKNHQRRASFRSFDQIEEPLINIPNKVVDFEGYPLNFSIFLPIKTHPLPANILIGQTELTNLKNYKKTAQGLQLDVEAILDLSMTGPIIAFVEYIDCNNIIRRAQLFAKVEVIPRQHIDEKTIGFKRTIRRSLSELDLSKKPRHGLPHKSLTIEEIKGSALYRSYQQRLEMDGIFFRPRSAEPYVGRFSTLLPSTEVCLGVYDFCSPLKRSATNGLLMKVNHLNGVPVPNRKAISLNGTPVHPVPNKLFAQCHRYNKRTPTEVIPEVLTPESIFKWRSEEQFPEMPLCPPNNETTDNRNEIPLKTKIKNIRKELTTVTELTNEWFHRTWLWWYSVQRSYATFNEGMRRMNRRDFNL